MAWDMAGDGRRGSVRRHSSGSAKPNGAEHIVLGAWAQWVTGGSTGPAAWRPGGVGCPVGVRGLEGVFGPEGVRGLEVVIRYISSRRSGGSFDGVGWAAIRAGTSVLAGGIVRGLLVSLVAGQRPVRTHARPLLLVEVGVVLRRYAALVGLVVVATGPVR